MSRSKKDCIILAQTNKAESKLYNIIYNNIANQNEELALEYYASFYSDEFVDDFGNWVKDYGKPNKEKTSSISSSKLFDETQEPKLIYDKKEGAYFYRNKYDNKRYFPPLKDHLSELYEYSDIYNISRILMFNYISSNIDTDFNSIDLTDLDEPLENSIKNKLNDKIKQFENSGDEYELDEAELLKESLLYTNEWVKEVESRFNEIKLVYKEDTEEDEIIEDENSTRDEGVVRKQSFERSSKENISANIKLRLSLLKEPAIYDKDGELVNGDEIFNEPKFIPFDTVYGILSQALVNKIPNYKPDNFQSLFDVYLEEIKTLSERHPYFEPLYKALSSDNLDDNVMFEFTQAFNLHKNAHWVVEYDTDNKGDKTFNVLDASNVGSRYLTIQDEWHHKFMQKHTTDEGFLITDDIEVGLSALTGVHDAIAGYTQDGKRTPGLYENFNTKRRSKGYQTEADLTTLKSSINNLLVELGIEVEEEIRDYWFDGTVKKVSLDQKLDNIRDILKGMMELSKGLKNYKILAHKTNPFKSQSIFSDLGKAYTFYYPDNGDNNIRVAGKNKWAFGKPSYISNRILEFKNNPEKLEAIASTVQGQSSKWIDYLLAKEYSGDEAMRKQESVKRLEQFEFGPFAVFQEKGEAAKGTDNKSIANNDFTAVTINNVLKDNPLYNTPTPADKSNHHQIKLGFKIPDSGIRFFADRGYDINDEVVETFFEYFNSEYKRMHQVARDINGELLEDQLKVHYHLGNRNGLKSQLFPGLSFENFNKHSIGTTFELYKKDGTPAVKDLTTLADGTNNLKEDLKSYIKSVLIKNILDTQKLLESKQIFEKTKEGYNINGIDKNIVEKYQKLSPKQYLLKMTGDAYINGAIAGIEYTKLFSGDMAFYKNPVDYKKRVPATYIDGLVPTLTNLNPEEQYFNASVIESVEIGTPYMSELKEILPKNLWKYYSSGINAADAQAWITPKRWKFLMTKLGKWNDGYDIVYDKMMGINKEPFTEKELKKAASPLKGVYFEINNGAPVYLKYSQAVLLPSLIKGSPLEKLYNKMEEGNIDETITLDGVKVGANKPVRTHDDNGNILDDFELTSMSLKNSGWRLQQDLPVKTYKNTDIGSQIQKNIFSGLAFNLDEDFNVGDEKMKGKDLINRINDIVGALSDHGKTVLAEEFKIGANGKIGNYDRVYSAVIDELKQRGGNRDVIKALERNITPYGIPQAQETLMNVFSSIFMKKLVKIKTNGGSFIQMSNYGMNKNEAEKKGVIWSPKIPNGGTVSEPKYARDSDGNIVYKDGKPVIQPGQILISGSFIAKYIPDYRKYTAKQLFGEWNSETNRYEAYEENSKTVQPKIDSKILQDIIGYRIPNQALASNDSLEIVGILPETAGDTVVAYTGITAKTGSDFDIDKMYIMMPSYIPARQGFSKVTDFMYSTIRGKDFEETFINVEKIVEELKPEVRNDFYEKGHNLNKLAMQLFSKSEANDAVRDLASVILDKSTEGDSPIINGILQKSNALKVSRLIYQTPKYNKDGSLMRYDLQPKEALNNMLIEAYKAVLLNENTYGDLMTPIDFDFMKNDINDLYPTGDKDDLYHFDYFQDIDLKYEFVAGKAGVGMEANALVDHIRGTMTDMSISDVYLGRGNVNEIGETLLDREYSEQLDDVEINAYVKEYNTSKEEKDHISAEDLKKVKIAHSLSAVLNGFVDIAKDPFITRGNWTTQTTNVGNMLLRAGFHPLYVNAFLGQPIIKQYVAYVTNKEAKIVSDTGNMKDKFQLDEVAKKLKNKFITVGKKSVELSDIYSTLVKKAPDQDQIDETGEDTSIQNLNIKTIKGRMKIGKASDQEVNSAIEDMVTTHNEVFFSKGLKFEDMNLKYLRSQIKGESNSTDQMRILKKFYEFQEQSKKLKMSNDAAKLDVNGYGKSIASLHSLDNLINRMNAMSLIGNKASLSNFDQKFIKDGKRTLLGNYKINVVDWVKHVMENNPKMFFTSQKYIKNTFDRIAIDVTGDVLMDAEFGEKIEREYYSYLLSDFEPLVMTDEERLDLIESFPDEFLTLKDALPKGSYKLIDELSIKPGDQGLSYIIMSNKKRSVSSQIEITSSWKDMLNHENEQVVDIAEKLIKYSYLTSGFRMSISQFFTYIPTDWFIENKIDDYIAEQARLMNQHNKANDLDKNFIDQYYRHNMNNGQLVPYVFANQLYKAHNDIDNPRVEFSLDPQDIQSSSPRMYVKVKYQDKVNGIVQGEYEKLFKLRGYDEYGYPIYGNISPLGYTDSKSNKFIEYGYETRLEKSMFEPNNNSVFEISNEAISVIKDGVDKFLPELPSEPIDMSEDNENIEDDLKC